MKWVALALAGWTSAAAMVVELPKPGPGRAWLRLWYNPSREPVTALRVRVYFHSPVTSLILYPGPDRIWSQIPPQVKWEARTAEVLALAPNHDHLARTTPALLFELELDSLADKGVDSVRLAEALDAQ